jgi:hypothetical protein
MRSVCYLQQEPLDSLWYCLATERLQLRISLCVAAAVRARPAAMSARYCAMPICKVTGFSALNCTESKENSIYILTIANMSGILKLYQILFIFVEFCLIL